MMGRGLSELQKGILRKLLAATEAQEARDKADWPARRKRLARLGYDMPEEWQPSRLGPDWKPSPNRHYRKWKRGEWTATERADWSRALARLERRGLVIRQDVDYEGPAVKYTRFVKLTEQGRKLAQELTANIRTKGQTLADSGALAGE